MTSALSDDFADKLRQMYLEISRRTEKIERQLRSAYRPAMREDFILMQASTSNAVPAVTSSTTGIVPGTATDCKMLTINSSGDAVRCLAGRTLEVFNLGGAIPAGAPFWAHREFKTGKFVADGPPTSVASSVKVWGLRTSTVLTLDSTTHGANGWTMDGFRQPAGSSEFDFVSYSTASSTTVITLLKAGWYRCSQGANWKLIKSTTTGLWQWQSAFHYWQIHTAVTSGYGTTDIPSRTTIDNAFLIPPSSQVSGVIGQGSQISNRVHKQWLMRCSSGAQFTPRLSYGGGSGTLFGFVTVYESDIHISYVNDGIGKLSG